MYNNVTKVVMIVDVVSPTPYMLLRRAKNFEYRDDDSALQQFADYDDPVRALTDECRRVLKCISSTNQSTISTSKASTGLRDASWSRFEDVGFGATIEESDGEDDGDGSMLGPVRRSKGLRTQARSANSDLGRPTTPSWADFLSSGFIDENGKKPASSMIMPPGSVLPSIQTIQRGQSSQSHRRDLETQSNLEPGELASIEKLDLDDSFWWVWISSLAGEEPTSRKAVFGRCALIETVLSNGKWMIMEEQVKGAAPEPAPGAYIAEKKGFFGFTTRRGRHAKDKAMLKKGVQLVDPYIKAENFNPRNRANIAPDQHARIQAAAIQLQRRNQEQDRQTNGARRGRHEELSIKTNSVMTLQPMLMTEASQAMKWASQYDKKEVRAQYLGNNFAGRGSTSDLLSPPAPNGVHDNNSSISLMKPSLERELPPPPENVPLPTSPDPLPKDNPLSKLPIPTPPREGSLPKTPSPPPPEHDPLPLPPSPPPSSKFAQASAPVSPVEPAHTETAASPESKVTALPTAPSPPAARAAPVNFSEFHSIAPRKAVASPPLTQGKLSKKRNPGPGFKGIFGNKRGKELAIKSPAFPPVDTSEAIAAARAALAVKNKNQLMAQPVHQATTQPSRGMSKSIPINPQYPNSPPPLSTYQARETPPATSIPFAAALQHPTQDLGQHPFQRPVQSLAQHPAHHPAQEAAQHPSQRPVQSLPQHPAHHPAQNAAQHPAHPPVQPPFSAPFMRQDSEDEGLSRVDTNEREQADREFSTFDQGPLLEQPAFIPPGSPVKPQTAKSLEAEAHKPSTKAVSPQREEDLANEATDEVTDLTREISPVQDRWAQIRKNAAERAARQMEDQNRQNETMKPDDDETSGEESK